ncbi:unnamed protein product [Porites evermanni]|uniref:Apple domain-containing protein n=1 Tax=Porites evermanni TaxID=104178 RepID=A0ABN8MGP5_9CNID|nr:unnamed protein product [Porites evermanni]
MQLLYIIFVEALLTKLGKCNSECHDPSKVSFYHRVDDRQGIGSVIRAVPVFSVLHCADKCLRRKLCKHFKYFKTDSGMICELLKDVERLRNATNLLFAFIQQEFLSPDGCDDLKSPENLLKIPEANC